MSLAVTNVKKRSMGGAGFIVHGDITASGNYAAGGEVLAPALAALHPTNKEPDYVDINSQAGFVYQYNFTTKKMMVRGQEPTNAGAGVMALTELAAAAYPAGITGDVISFIAIWLPQLP